MGKKAKNRRIKRAVVRLERRGHHVTVWEQHNETYTSIANVIMSVSQQGILLQDKELVSFTKDAKLVEAKAVELAQRLKGLTIRVKELRGMHRGKTGIVPADQEELAMNIMVGYSEVGNEIQSTVLPLSVELSELLDEAHAARMVAKASAEKEVA